MAASGFAGLGYQIVWTRQSALWLGHDSAAVLAVVAAFLGGLAVGALVLGARIESSARPVRWYAACEALIALWGGSLIFTMAPASDALLALIGPQPTASRQWTVAFVGTFLLLLPATAAMGATLPAIERVLSRMQPGRRSIAALYASNTFGATVGVPVTAFWLIPRFGLVRTAAVCVVLNLICAVVSTRWSTDAPVVRAARVPSPSTSGRAVLARLAATGLLGIGYEIMVIRVLGQVCEDTVYTFAMLLAVYLLGSAAGAAAYRRWGSSAGSDRLLCALAASCFVGSGALWFAQSLQAIVVDALGGGLVAALGSEAALAVVAFALPTFAMGALFSLLADRAHDSGVPFGRALGVNIIGAAAAPALFGVLLAPLLGAKVVLAGIVAGYLLLTTRRAWLRPIVLVPAAATLVVAIAAPPLAFVDVPEGGRVVSYREGVMAAVSVVEDADGVSVLRIDNRQQEGSSATGLVDGRQALLPLLLHPSPRRALFLGLGTGVTASTAAQQAGLEVDAVELLPEVIEASAAFREPSSLHPMVADARRYVRTASTRYDLIVADNFHPARSGSGALYTVEHFRAVRERLDDGGLFCQWLPLHQLDLETLRSIVRSFLTAYPQGFAMLASNSLGTPVVGLVAHRDGGRFDVEAIRARLGRSGLPRSPSTWGIDDPLALLGSFIAGPRGLARFAGDAPQNTDDRPVVAYRAPWVTYSPQSLPQDRLVALLAALSVEPSDVLVDGADADTSRRLAAYWRARDRFIAAGRDVRPTSDVRAMLAQVRGPLLEVLSISPDFRPAYDPLLRMAAGLSRSDVGAARRLLVELDAAQPSRPEARQAMDRIDVGTARH